MNSPRRAVWLDFSFSSPTLRVRDKLSRTFPIRARLGRYKTWKSLPRTYRVGALRQEIQYLSLENSQKV